MPSLRSSRGRLACWGDNRLGQLGNGGVTDPTCFCVPNATSSDAVVVVSSPPSSFTPPASRSVTPSPVVLNDVTLGSKHAVSDGGIAGIVVGVTVAVVLSVVGAVWYVKHQRVRYNPVVMTSPHQPDVSSPQRSEVLPHSVGSVSAVETCNCPVDSDSMPTMSRQVSTDAEAS
jgi:hypothetical protein